MRRCHGEHSNGICLTHNHTTVWKIHVRAPIKTPCVRLSPLKRLVVMHYGALQFAALRDVLLSISL